MLNVKNNKYNSNIKSKDVKVRAYNLSLDIIKFTNSLPNKRAFWSISDQLLRSTTSIGANLIEAQAASSRRDFIKFYQIALKSSNETKYWLSLLKDSYMEYAVCCNTILEEVVEISNMLGSALLTLKGKKNI